MILVVAEQRDGKLNRATLETLAAAQALAGGEPDQGGGARAVRRRRRSGVGGQPSAKSLLVEHAALAILHAGRVRAWPCSRSSRRRSRRYVLLPAHVSDPRFCAPMAAVRIGGALITDVTGIKGTGCGATFVRPMFQGKLSAEVRPRAMAHDASRFRSVRFARMG